MPTPPPVTLADIREKIRELAAQRDEAREHIKKLESRISDLETDLDETRDELHRARLDVEYLTVSHRLADTPDALVTARKTIAALIRKVDSAINLLRNEPSEL